MVKKLTILSLALLLALPAFALTKNVGMKAGRDLIKPALNDNARTAKVPYTGTMAPYYDKSANGYGWYQGYNRKISWDIGGSAGGPMVGSIYRRLNATSGSGTIGGTIGNWTGDNLLSLAQDVYTETTNFGASQDPGGRYPYSCGFINGYFFGVFNDYNTATGVSGDSYPMFSVADATFGYDFSYWTVGVAAATDGGATVPGAWTGSGDVVYDPATGYYYWSQAWNQDLVGLGEFIISCVVGRTMTPADPASWVWSDYNDLTFDTSDDTSGLTDINDVSWSYCKDRYGNGTGYGIAVAMANDVDDKVMVDSTEVLLNPRISYMYTTDWGGSDASGDWTPNWQTDVDGKWFQIDPKNLFDWYGSTLTEIDSSVTPPDTSITYMNDPFITWNISSVATENNIVHLVIRAFGGTYLGDYVGYLMYMNDDDYVDGYYHVRGEITDSGVNWSKATLIASNIGHIEPIDDNGETVTIEFVYTNFNVLSIGYAGFGQVYASWLDRPINRPTLNAWAEPDTEFYDDAYVSFSADDGNTWELAEGGHQEVEFEDEPGKIYNLYYCQNVTNTGSLHEEGWSVATTGKITAGEVEIYGAHQYYDAANPLAPPVNSFYDHQQFLHAWKITGSLSAETGITADNVAIDTYELMQNYPNPFNPTTEISFNMMNDANVKLSVFNAKGEMVSELVNGPLSKGFHKVNFDASELNSGVYFYQLDANGFKTTKKMVLAK